MFTPFSEDNIQIDQQDVVSDQQINQQLDKEDALRKQQEQEAEAKAAAEEKKIKDSTDPKTGRPKSTFETLDPKQFGLAENAQEAVNAVGGGAIDAIAFWHFLSFSIPIFIRLVRNTNHHSFRSKSLLPVLFGAM